jgi:uncharacterized membrane-anchored protein
VLSLLDYAIKPLPSAGLLSPTTLLAVLVPIVAAFVWIRMRRRRIRPLL